MNVSKNNHNSAGISHMVKKIDNTIADQKATYERAKEQERKRRFAIVSGNIKPIQTTFHLQNGEHAYYQFETERMADHEYVETHTTGNTTRKGTIQRAVVGDLLFGKAGAIIGGVTGKSETQYETTQNRVVKTETIDSGTMLFTNKRMVFIGKEIISIPYADILTVSFDSTILSVKYPAMVKNECYYTGTNSDVALYYNGIMRLIGRDKSTITEADIAMAEYPAFVSGVIRNVKTIVIKNFLIASGIFIVMSIFLKGVIVPVNYILAIMFVISGVGCIGIVCKLRNYTEYQKMITKKLFYWSMPLLLFGLILAAPSSETTSYQTTHTKTHPTVANVTPTPDLQAHKEKLAEDTYVATKSALLTQFFTEDALVQKDFQNPQLSDYQRIADAQAAYKYYDSLHFCLDCNLESLPTKYSNYESYISDEETVAEEAIQDYYLSLQHGDHYNANVAQALYNGAVNFMRAPIHYISDDDLQADTTGEHLTQERELLKIPYDTSNQ